MASITAPREHNPPHPQLHRSFLRTAQIRKRSPFYIAFPEFSSLPSLARCAKRHRRQCWKLDALETLAFDARASGWANEIHPFR